MAARREHWTGIGDPAARFWHHSLYNTLQERFAAGFERQATSEDLPLHLAYDGLLWVVQAGVVSEEADNPALRTLPLTLRRSVHVPELFRADISLPGIHTSYYEYSENGGFNLDKNGTPGSAVYKGQYVSMHDMVTHMETDPELTAVAAAGVTLAYCMEHPEDLPPAEAFAQMLPPDAGFPPQAA